MPKKRYIVNLTADEREALVALTSKGEIRARKMKRAQILLKADQGATDAEIIAALGVSRPCVERLRQRFVEGGLERGLNEAPRPGQTPKLNGKRVSENYPCGNIKSRASLWNDPIPANLPD